MHKEEPRSSDIRLALVCLSWNRRHRRNVKHAWVILRVPQSCIRSSVNATASSTIPINGQQNHGCWTHARPCSSYWKCHSAFKKGKSEKRRKCLSIGKPLINSNERTKQNGFLQFCTTFPISTSNHTYGSRSATHFVTTASALSSLVYQIARRQTTSWTFSSLLSTTFSITSGQVCHSTTLRQWWRLSTTHQPLSQL